MSTVKQKIQKLVFNPADKSVVEFLDELLRLAKDAFEIAAHAIIEQFIYAKMPPHLKKKTNQAHWENGTYERIVTHLEMELKLNGLEAPDELQMKTVGHNSANTNADRPKPTSHHCKKNPDITKISAVCEKGKKSSLKILKSILEPKTVAPTTLSRTKTQTIITKTPKLVTELRKSQELFIHPVRHVGRQTTPQRKTTMEPMKPNHRLPCKDDRKDRIRSKKEPIKMTRMKLLRPQPNI